MRRDLLLQTQPLPDAFWCRAAFEQVGGKRVAQGLWTGARGSRIGNAGGLDHGIDGAQHGGFVHRAS